MQYSCIMLWTDLAMGLMTTQRVLREGCWTTTSRDPSHRGADRLLCTFNAEDGLLGEDEMSQLAGKALDLRNSAALLKLARMSVDTMTQPTGKPQNGEHTKVSHNSPCSEKLSCVLQFVMLKCALTTCPHCIALTMQEISELTGQGRWTLRTAQMTAPGVPGKLTWRARPRLSRRSRRACRQPPAGRRVRGVPPPYAGSTPGCARARRGRRRRERCLPASARTALQVPGNEDTVLLSHHVQLLILQSY